MNKMPDDTLIALTTLPLSILAVRRAMVSYEKSFELVPANASTVLTHLLTGLFLTLGYVLAGLGISFQDTLLFGFFLLAVTLFLSVKIHRRPPPA